MNGEGFGFGIQNPGCKIQHCSPPSSILHPPMIYLGITPNPLVDVPKPPLVPKAPNPLVPNRLIEFVTANEFVAFKPFVSGPSPVFGTPIPVLGTPMPVFGAPRPLLGWPSP